ncbi:hypothetical protein JGR76_23720, partial [Salmonella enterica subsp. enterica serovar Montevideo]|uniref:hypothetical protein n=3 Tax=Pseudomonadota TaxID=1224 RepID=UPI0018EB630A
FKHRLNRLERFKEHLHGAFFERRELIGIGVMIRGHGAILLENGSGPRGESGVIFFSFRGMNALATMQGSKSWGAQLR